MAKFTYAGQLNGAENPVALDIVIKNSAAVVVDNPVYLSSGVTPATTSSRILGICVGIYKDQIPLENVAAADLDGTYAPSTQTYTAASDNVTVAKIKAKVVVDKWALWKNDADADMTVLMEGQLFHLASASQIDGDTNAADKGQFVLIKVDPTDASVGTFCIAESSLDPYVQIT